MDTTGLNGGDHYIDAVINVFNTIAKLLQHRERQPIHTRALVFSHVCEIIFLILVMAIYGDNTESLENVLLKLLVIFYLYLTNRVVSLNKRFVYYLIMSGNVFRNMCFHECELFLKILLLTNCLFIIPMFLLFNGLRLFMIFYLVVHVIMPYLYKQLYHYVALILETKSFYTPSGYRLYILVQCIHALLVIVLVFLSYWFVWRDGFVPFLYHDDGVVKHYEQQSGNGIRKCSEQEYLSRITFKFDDINLRNTYSTCSAITGEYVTFNCKTSTTGLHDQIRFIWMNDKNEITNSRKYVITFYKKTYFPSGIHVSSSNLTINDIGDSDYRMYTCLIVNTSKYESFEKNKSISLVRYTGNLYTIRAPLGYLIKLKNIFRVRFNGTISNTAFIHTTDNGQRHITACRFNFCYPSIVKYHLLDETKARQDIETEFCTCLMYGKYILKIELSSGFDIIHPSSLLILPKIADNLSKNAPLHRSTWYKYKINEYRSSFNWIDDSEAFLMNSVEEVLLYFNTEIENNLRFNVVLLLVVCFILEYLFYTKLRLRILKTVDIPTRYMGNKKEYDVFLFFCEGCLADSAFAMEKLANHLEDNEFTITVCEMIRAGKPIQETYRDEIQKCKKIIVVWSDNFAADDDCMFLIRSVLPSLHRDKLIEQTDIITICYKCNVIPVMVHGILHKDYSTAVWEESRVELDRVCDVIERSMVESSNIFERLRNHVFVRFVSNVFVIIRKLFLIIVLPLHRLCMTVLENIE